jgi:hypothetical protein
VIHQPPFHIALSVGDLDAAAAQLGPLGLDWRPTLEYPLCLLHHDVEATVELRSVYSAGSAPAVELFEIVSGAGTPLDPPVPGSLFHHVGLWADDFSADVDRLRAIGWDLAATVPDDRGRPSRFALHRTPFGFYVELVDPKWAGRLLSDLLPGPAPGSGSGAR